jgi:hypothetical protein
MEERKCNKCEVTKPIDDFYKSNRKGDKRPDERSYECKECTKARVKENHCPETYRRQHLLRTYDITPEKYDAMLAEQDGHCATCPATDPGNSRRSVYFCVDHSHTTGEVRGLLCHNCNTALGLLKDDPERLANLIKYVA